MISSLTAVQRAQIQQMNRGFTYGSGANSGFAQLIADMLATLGSGSIGIQSNAWDVDSLALNGGAFSQDADTTTALTFGYYNGSVYNGSANVTTAAGTIALTASATNYVEVDNAGTVHNNTVGFTAGRLPLYVISTSSGGINAVVNAKTLLTLLGPSSVTGAMLTPAGASKSTEIRLGTITTTQTYLCIAPCTGVLTGATLSCPTVVTANNTNYWTVAATELGQSNAGTQPLLAATAANTTQATGGFSLAANIPQALALIALSGGNTQRNVIEGDIIPVTCTATGAPSALTGSILRLKFAFSN